MEQIEVKGLSINITGIEDDDYISLTDIARIKNPKEPKDVVKNWMRSRSTLEYLGLWEKMNNSEFRGVDFEPLLSETGKHSFTMSPTRWINEFNAIGIKTKATKNGGSILTKEYFEQLLERIREIRTSERKLYQKITDIYATSIDYDSDSKITQRFFQNVQNKMHYAIHGQTASEVIYNRVDSNKENMD